MRDLAGIQSQCSWKSIKLPYICNTLPLKRPKVFNSSVTLPMSSCYLSGCTRLKYLIRRLDCYFYGNLTEWELMAHINILSIQKHFSDSRVISLWHRVCLLMSHPSRMAFWWLGLPDIHCWLIFKVRAGSGWKQERHPISWSSLHSITSTSGTTLRY